MKYFYTKYAMATFITFDNSLGDYMYEMNTQVYLCTYGFIWWQPSTLFYILEYLSCLSRYFSLHIRSRSRIFHLESCLSLSIPRYFSCKISRYRVFFCLKYDNYVLCILVIYVKVSHVEVSYSIRY